ncbi:DUF4397 domain-containing protein [Sphingobacterium sp. SRCM116780]|uniref:DUF4397 domain-containing protein n=1 Tax=Sphingobacterium sp. SRCM116780 TaxID=2907623 RepID=UPI001F241827|nr:DUF4397 domain-containing protein [Sphingobacterium sp. SRCM116780]UIR57393.1 DUF4397 domain-containing protein [Sphingobacterium sp. SRCM116780]
MKNIKVISKLVSLSLLIFLILFLYSCQEEETFQVETGIAKVNVINAIVSGGKIKANVSAKKLNWIDIPDDQVLGEWNLGRLYIVPTDKATILQIASLTDTTKLWYNHQANLKKGKMYSLYLSGTPNAIDTLFKEETDFPDYILRDAGKLTPTTDSIVNIRFVNLSPSGPKVDINIQGMSTKEVNGLEYQTFTNFKAYPATKDIYNIVFEIRRSSDQQLVDTYYFSVDNFRFKSVAVVMMGIYPSVPTNPYTDNYRIESFLYQ